MGSDTESRTEHGKGGAENRLRRRRRRGRGGDTTDSTGGSEGSSDGGGRGEGSGKRAGKPGLRRNAASERSGAPAVPRLPIGRVRDTNLRDSPAQRDERGDGDGDGAPGYNEATANRFASNPELGSAAPDAYSPPGVLLEGVLTQRTTNWLCNKFKRRYFALDISKREIRVYREARETRYGRIYLGQRAAIPLAMVREVSVPADPTGKYRGCRFHVKYERFGHTRFSGSFLNESLGLPVAEFTAELVADTSEVARQWVEVLAEFVRADDGMEEAIERALETARKRGVTPRTAGDDGAGGEGGSRPRSKKRRDRRGRRARREPDRRAGAGAGSGDDPDGGGALTDDERPGGDASGPRVPSRRARARDRGRGESVRAEGGSGADDAGSDDGRTRQNRRREEPRHRTGSDSDVSNGE